MSVSIPADTATLSPVRSATKGTSDSICSRSLSSGPLIASTMQNSDAPRSAVCCAACNTSSVLRSGVAATGEPVRAD